MVTPVNPIIAYGMPAFALATASLATLTYASLAPANGLWGTVLHRGDSSGTPRYALTFDDGPTPGATDRILDTLASLNVHAAFFVIGVNIEQSPDLLRRIHNDGHLIGNHTYHHSHYGMMRGKKYWRQEIDRTDGIIEQIIGVRPALFRPPMGFKTPYVHRAATRAQQRVVTWSRRAFDGVETTTEQILRRLVPHTVAGDVLMLHDGIEPNRARKTSASVAAVKTLIERLRSRGLEPARLDTLLRIPPYCAAVSA